MDHLPFSTNAMMSQTENLRLDFRVGGRVNLTMLTKALDCNSGEPTLFS